MRASPYRLLAPSDLWCRGGSSGDTAGMVYVHILYHNTPTNIFLLKIVNVTKGQPSPSIVNSHHRCLRVITEEEYYYNHSPPRPQYRRQRSVSLSPPYDPYQTRLPPQHYRADSQPRIHGSSQYYHSNGYQGNQAYYYQAARRPERRSLWGRFFS
jgi:hypothetical protein